jgi:hypothetical protein
MLAARLSGVDRLWIVTDPGDHRFPTYGPFSAIRAAVTAAFARTVDESFPGMDVTLYVRR